MAAAASAPTAIAAAEGVAAAVDKGPDDPTCPAILTQPDGMEEDSDDDDNDDDDDDDDEGDDEDGEEEEDEGDSGEAADSTALEEVLLLVDAANGFNNLSRYSMLWTVRHRCPRLSRLTFNCYWHQVRLICRQPGGEPDIILSKEGVS